jgi:hypothetical protein
MQGNAQVDGQLKTPVSRETSECSKIEAEIPEQNLPSHPHS